jgi:hypothetical protein
VTNDCCNEEVITYLWLPRIVWLTWKPRWKTFHVEENLKYSPSLIC